MHQYRRAQRAIILAAATACVACSDSPSAPTPQESSATVQFDGPMPRSWSVSGNPVLVNGRVDTSRDVVYLSSATWPTFQVPNVISALRPARPGELNSYLYMQLHPAITGPGTYRPGDCTPISPFSTSAR